MLIPSELNALIVDDNDHGRLLAEQALKQVGISNIFGADDVISALKILQTKQIDFILLDWYMPEINGAGFARLIRKGLVESKAQNSLAEIPIIITTAYATRENTARIRELGLREVLAKPFSVKQLGTAISIALAHLTQNVLLQFPTSEDSKDTESDYVELTEEDEDQYLL